MSEKLDRLLCAVDMVISDALFYPEDEWRPPNMLAPQECIDELRAACKAFDIESTEEVQRLLGAADDVVGDSSEFVDDDLPMMLVRSCFMGNLFLAYEPFDPEIERD